jgi:phosphopentomutase
VNLVDFDMLYGHRNDPQGYARALEELDRALPRLLGRLRPGDVAAITADHGCDPTTPSTDHSREYVPLLVHAPGAGGGDLGTRGSFADLGAAVAEHFGVRVEVGESFLPALRR